MKTLLALLLLLEHAFHVKASPVLHESPPSLVEGHAKQVTGPLKDGGAYSLSSHDTKDAPRRYKIRRLDIDNTLVPWSPPDKRLGESDKAYRNRYLKAESADRVDREAKAVVLEHIPDAEKASQAFLQFRLEQQANVYQRRKVRWAKGDQDLNPEEKRIRDRERWRNAKKRFRIRERYSQSNGSVDEDLLEEARQAGMDPATLHEKPAQGRKGEVKERVYAFLLKHGHINEKIMKAAEQGIPHFDESTPSPIVSSTDKKNNFMNGIQRKARTKKARANTLGSSPSTPPGSEALQRDTESSSRSSESLASGALPFPRKKRSRTMIVDARLGPSQTKTSPLDVIEHQHQVPSSFPQRTRTSVAKKQKLLKDTFHSIFGDSDSEM